MDTKHLARNLCRHALLATAASWVVSAPAFAQSTEPAAAETAPAPADTAPAPVEDDASSIAVIVVTAQKREQRLQDVPMSVAVLDEKLLERTATVSLIDYATRVPNLSFGATQPVALMPFSLQIRGIGAGTGFYIDDVPVPEVINPRVMDVSRIEVLRGPQGTLYGARNMAGTVRLVTRPADLDVQEFKLHASTATVAEGDLDYSVDGAFNVPIAANAAFRGGVYYQHETGVHDVEVDNDVTNDHASFKNADDGDYWGFQAGVIWDVTDRFTVEPKVIYQKSHLGYLPYSDLRPGNFTINRLTSLKDKQDMKFGIASLTLGWDLGWGRLTSATGLFRHEHTAREEWSDFYNLFSNILGGDPDYFPPGGVMFALTEKLKQFTEEVRFTSDFSGPLTLTAGLYYSNSKTTRLAPCSGSTGIGWDAQIAAFDFGTDCAFFLDQSTRIKDAAVFGEAEYALVDNLKLTLGGRYSHNSLDFYRLNTGWVVDFGAPSKPPAIGKQKESGFNPKAALTWNVNPDWTLYTLASKGFRGGGINLTPPPENLCGAELEAIGFDGTPDTFKSDSLWNYEVGSKSRHFDGRLAINAAAFYLDWSDIIQRTQLQCGFGFTNNTGKAAVKGFEVEMSARPIDALSLSLGVGYSDAKITDPEDAANVQKGDRLNQVPKWTFSSSAEYNFPIGRHEGYAFVSYSYISESVSYNSGLNNPANRDAYGLLDGRVGIEIGKLDLSLYAKNILNKHANLADQLALTVDIVPRFVINRPRTIGIDARWKY